MAEMRKRGGRKQEGSQDGPEIPEWTSAWLGVGGPLPSAPHPHPYIPPGPREGAGKQERGPLCSYLLFGKTKLEKEGFNK